MQKHKKIIAYILCTLLVFLSSATYGNNNRVNPPREELEKKIEEVARRKGIPSVILKSIARVESVFKQFNSDGTVYTGRSGSIGLMQIYNAYGVYDTNRLKYDIDYNIEAGAEVLLSKWKMANERLPKIGDMNPNILEHWYFAIWAYNGWLQRNNPNAVGSKKHTYQQLVYMIAEKEYGQKITPIDPNLLPKTGLPSKGLKFDTPSEFHYGDIEMYKPGDVVKVDVLNNNLTLKNSPNGKGIGSFSEGTILDVVEGPQLNGGFFWYKVRTKDGSQEGWVAGNWITKENENTDNNNYSKEDAAKYNQYMNKLHELGILVGDGSGDFQPNKLLTREEMSVFIGRMLNLKDVDYNLDYADSSEIEPWAQDYVRALSKKGIVSGFEDNTFRPKRYVTREELAVILSRILDKEINALNKEIADIDMVSPWAKDSVQSIVNANIINLKNGYFNPNEYVTRGEFSLILYTLIQHMIYG